MNRRIGSLHFRSGREPLRHLAASRKSRHDDARQIREASTLDDQAYQGVDRLKGADLLPRQGVHRGFARRPTMCVPKEILVAALVVRSFQPWRNNECRVSMIAVACNFAQVFELGGGA